MVAVSFAPFEPDKARFNIGALPDIVNAVPTADGWGPLKGGATVEPQFAYLTDIDNNRLVDQDGNYIVTGVRYSFLTDESGAYLTDEAGEFFITDITGVPISTTTGIADPVLGCTACRVESGLERIFAGTATKLYELDTDAFAFNDVSRTVGGAYGATSRWSFARFGSFVYAANGVDTEQMMDLEAGSNFVANSTAPVAKYLAVVGDFLFRGNIVDYPYQVQWSAINDPQSNTATVNLSDYQDIPTGDEVMGIVPLSDGAHVWMRSALHKMSFALNSEYVFSRNQLTEMRGTSAPYSIGLIAQDDYGVYCDDGFWRYSGGQFTPIGLAKVNAWFLTECNQDERGNIVAMADPERQVLWWAYTAMDGTRKLLGYHYVFDRWCVAEISAQASMRARTFANVDAGLFITTNDLLRFAYINEDGQLAYLTGDNLAATIETNEIQLDPTTRAFVNGGRLQGDPTTFTVVQKTGDYMGGTLTARSAVSPSTRTKFISLRGDGKVHKFTVAIPASEVWTTINGMEIDVTRGGKS